MNIFDILPPELGSTPEGRTALATELKGKPFILYSYPKAGTQGCTAEACSLEQHRTEIEQAGFSIVGISKDSTAALERFREKYSLGFELISDQSLQTLKALGMWGEKKLYGKTSEGILRTTLVVDATGEILYRFSPKQIKTAKHAEQILEFIHAKDERNE